MEGVPGPMPDAGCPLQAWDWNKIAPNNFVASCDIPLIQVARGTMWQVR